jgi:hypothetical protein
MAFCCAWFSGLFCCCAGTDLALTAAADRDVVVVHDVYEKNGKGGGSKAISCDIEEYSLNDVPSLILTPFFKDTQLTITSLRAQYPQATWVFAMEGRKLLGALCYYKLNGAELQKLKHFNATVEYGIAQARIIKAKNDARSGVAKALIRHVIAKCKGTIIMETEVGVEPCWKNALKINKFKCDNSENTTHLIYIHTFKNDTNNTHSTDEDEDDEENNDVKPNEDDDEDNQDKDETN